MTVSVHVDARDLVKLRLALRDAGAGYKRADAILAQSMNRAGQRIRTKLVADLRQWTGILRRGAIADRVRPVIASPGKMSAGARVQGRHLRITRADFAAAWRRSWPGGRHKAWARGQTAKHSFMMATGKRAGILVTRTTSRRYPIKPLWGPNVAREVHRHREEVMAMVRLEAAWFNREAIRRAGVELRTVKARYGL